MTEDRRPNRAADKPDKEDAECLENPDQGSGFGEEERSKDQCSHLAVEQEVVPFDRRSDRAGDQGAAQLRAMLGVADAGGCHFSAGHVSSTMSAVGPARSLLLAR